FIMLPLGIRLSKIGKLISSKLRVISLLLIMLTYFMLAQISKAKYSLSKCSSGFSDISRNSTVSLSSDKVKG
ncbi:hypothetical protein OFN04_30165, partial [Escherichia coli]|nr:hypothetical protein [Escherichia coli]